MRISILVCVLLWASIAAGAIRHVPIQSAVLLRAGEAYTLTIEAAAATEIGWRAAKETCLRPWQAKRST